MMKGSILVDWGVKVVKSGRKNERCLWHVAKLIETYAPKIVAMENCSKNARRSGRVQGLVEEIAGLAGENGIKVRSFSRKQVNLKILRNQTGTKREIAVNLAGKYRGQLSFRLPEKRRLWQSEAYQMDIFAAVALAQCSKR
jgi:Holliday junction resolvasome RuvABC endonuclease subunit